MYEPAEVTARFICIDSHFTALSLQDMLDPMLLQGLFQALNDHILTSAIGTAFHSSMHRHPFHKPAADGPAS